MTNVNKYLPNLDKIVKRNEPFVKRACRKVEQMYDEIKQFKKLVLALRVLFFEKALTFECLNLLSDYYRTAVYTNRLLEHKLSSYNLYMFVYDIVHVYCALLIAYRSNRSSTNSNTSVAPVKLGAWLFFTQ